MRIAINGFGRIGRNFLRTICTAPEAQKVLEVVVINVGPAHPDMIAHMFKYDTLLGTFNGDVCYADGILTVDNFKIRVIAECDSSNLNWSEYAVDWVVDASGCFTSADTACIHINAGAKYVLVTAPCKGNIPTIVPGVNDNIVDLKKDHIFSLASCTTNAVTPMLKVLHEAFEIEQGYMTTVHAYTNSQVLIDVNAKNLRTSRAAALNIIPSGTGAARSIDLVLPMLAGRIQAGSLRVPVAKVSLIDLVVLTKSRVNINAVNEAFDAAADADLKGIMCVSREELVSSDFSGCSASVIIDALLTQAQGNLCKTFGWYDNEWGYSCRLKDFLIKVSYENKR